jgi:hypothetical protein
MTSAKRCALLASSQRRSACWSTAQAPYNVHFPEREMHLNRSESRMLTHRTNVIHHCALIRNLLFWGPGVDAHNHQWSGNRARAMLLNAAKVALMQLSHCNVGLRMALSGLFEQHFGLTSCKQQHTSRAPGILNRSRTIEMVWLEWQPGVKRFCRLHRLQECT